MKITLEEIAEPMLNAAGIVLFFGGIIYGMSQAENSIKKAAVAVIGGSASGIACFYAAEHMKKKKEDKYIN